MPDDKVTQIILSAIKEIRSDVKVILVNQSKTDTQQITLFKNYNKQCEKIEALEADVETIKKQPGTEALAKWKRLTGLLISVMLILVSAFVGWIIK